MSTSSLAANAGRWQWENLNTGLIFGMDENPVTLGEVLDETTDFRITLMDGVHDPAVAEVRVLVSHPNFIDANGDGCNDINDLYELLEFWLTPGNDPSGDQFWDVRDYLYIDISGECPL